MSSSISAGYSAIEHEEPGHWAEQAIFSGRDGPQKAFSSRASRLNGRFVVSQTQATLRKAAHRFHSSRVQGYVGCKRAATRKNSGLQG